MRTKTILAESPEEIVQKAFDTNENPGAYLVYIKYLGMPESEFISYHPIEIKNGAFIIDDKKYTVALIESITVRCIQNIAPDTPIEVKSETEYRLSPEAAKMRINPSLQAAFQLMLNEK